MAKADILSQIYASKKTDYDSIKSFGMLETDIKLNESEILFNRIETK